MLVKFINYFFNFQLNELLDNFFIIYNEKNSGLCKFIFINYMFKFHEKPS